MQNKQTSFTYRILQRLSCVFVMLITFVSLQLAVCNSKATALEMQVQNVTGNAGDTVTVDITVADYSLEQIAAAVFTLTYNGDYLTLANVESTFFDTFLNQWNLLDPVPSPLPETSVEIDGQIYTQPLLFNTVPSTTQYSTMIAGVRVVAGTPTTLFTLTFTIDETAPNAIYPISIQPTIIDNTAAGYSSAGESIPILTDYIEGETDPALAYPTYSPTIINGRIVVEAVFVDTDGDGIEDSWEMTHFNSLDVADSTSDFDNDGYTDLQEYLNSVALETDPLGADYDPRVANAPGGTGYNPPRNTGAAVWNFMLLIQQ